MERNGKNGVGLGGASARGRVAFARVKVVLARVGVGTGQEKEPFFFHEKADLWKAAGLKRDAGPVSTAFGPVLRLFVECVFYNTGF